MRYMYSIIFCHFVVRLKEHTWSSSDYNSLEAFAEGCVLSPSVFVLQIVGEHFLADEDLNF